MPQKTNHAEIPVVAIAQIGNFEHGHAKFVERNAPLMRAIGERGFKAVALNGAKDRTEENRFSRFYVPEDDLLVVREKEVAVDAAHDLSGGIGKYVPDVLALNPKAIRDLAHSKIQQARLLREKLGDAIPETTVCQATRQEVENSLEEMEAAKVIIKANSDPGKKHPMLIGSKAEVLVRLDDLLTGMKPDSQVLIQEYMSEVNGGFASGIHYADSLEKEFADIKRDGAREIRTHVIDETPVAVMGRVGLKIDDRTHDKWVHFDPDSVPQAIPDLAVNVAKAFRQKTGVEDSHLAVDFTPDGERIIEVNGRNIGTMRPSTERPAVQRVHELTTNALADKLTVMADRKRSV